MLSVDTTRAGSPHSLDSLASLVPVACFSVMAEADPSAMPRVLEVFALRSLVPSRWHSTRVAPEADTRGADRLAIDIQVAGLDGEAAEAIVRRLRALICVRSVLRSEQHLRRVV